MLIKRENLPKISVIIPSFNKVAYIEATLRSIINQNYPNLEVIVQDGKSTDGTAEIIAKYARQYPKLFKFESKRDNGQVDAINKGFKKASGEILTYINADDVYKKDALTVVGRCFKKFPKTLWITGYGDIIDEKDNIRSGFVTAYKNVLLHINRYILLLAVNFITQPATFLSKSAYEKFGPFTGTRNYVMEYDLWLRLGKIQMPLVIAQTLSSFRLTRNNISSVSAKELLKIDNQLVEKYTNNGIILALHKLHNLGRIFLLNFI